jgi:hypothetical protein
MWEIVTCYGIHTVVDSEEQFSYWQWRHSESQTSGCLWEVIDLFRLRIHWTAVRLCLVCARKHLSFYRAPCSSELSTQFKFDLLLTGKLNNGHQLKTKEAAIHHNVFSRNYKIPQQDYTGRDVSYPRCQGQSFSSHSRTVNIFVAYVRISVAYINTKNCDWMISTAVPCILMLSNLLLVQLMQN